MEKKRQIDCFLPYGTASMVDSLIAQLSKERVVKDIYVLAAEGVSVDTLPQRTQLLQTDSLLSYKWLKRRMQAWFMLIIIRLKVVRVSSIQ